MENISMFLTGAEAYGVGKGDLFQVSFSSLFVVLRHDDVDYLNAKKMPGGTWGRNNGSN